MTPRSLSLQCFRAEKNPLFSWGVYRIDKFQQATFLLVLGFYEEGECFCQNHHRHHHHHHHHHQQDRLHCIAISTIIATIVIIAITANMIIIIIILLPKPFPPPFYLPPRRWMLTARLWQFNISATSLQSPSEPMRRATHPNLANFEGSY